MRIRHGSALALAFLLVAASGGPAYADTVTTHDVPLSEVLPTPSQPIPTDTWGGFDSQTAPVWAPVGAVVLPFTATSAESASQASVLRIPPAPAGCSRVLNSYHYTYSAVDATPYGGLIYPDLTRAQYTYIQDAGSTAASGGWTVGAPTPYNVEDLAFVYQVIVYPGGDGGSFTFEDFTFNVTDTCASAEASLPDSGWSGLALAIAAAMALALGTALVLAARRRA